VPNPFSARTELLILSLLQNESADTYALALVKAAGGKLKRGTIYITLGRLEEKNLIEVVAVPHFRHTGLPRSQYRLTGLGRRVLAAADLTGLPTARGLAP